MSGERGSAVPLMLGVAGLVLLLLVGVADAGLMIAGRYQAAIAADAAALASAPVTFRPFGAQGTARQEAARFAAMNGAGLIVCRCPTDRSWRGRTVEVVVERTVSLVGGIEITVRARSAAEFDPTMAFLERSAEQPVVGKIGNHFVGVSVEKDHRAATSGAQPSG